MNTNNNDECGLKKEEPFECKIPLYKAKNHDSRIEADKARYYTEIAGSYDELYKDEQVKKIKLIIDNFPFSEEESLLDVGCGTGFGFDYWPTKKDDSWGVEPSSGLIKQSKHEDRILHDRAENLPFNDDEFDVVVSITAIQNFEFVEDGLLEMKRVGKKKFVFSVLKKSPNFKDVDALIKKHFKVTKELEEEKDMIYLIY